jgi:hypothetical protein
VETRAAEAKGAWGAAAVAGMRERGRRGDGGAAAVAGMGERLGHGEANLWREERQRLGHGEAAAGAGTWGSGGWRGDGGAAAAGKGMAERRPARGQGQQLERERGDGGGMSGARGPGGWRRRTCSRRRGVRRPGSHPHLEAQEEEKKMSEDREVFFFWISFSFFF